MATPTEWSTFAQSGGASQPVPTIDSTFARIGGASPLGARWTSTSSVYVNGIRQNTGYNLSKLDGITTHTFRVRVAVYTSASATVYVHLQSSSSATHALTDTYNGVDVAEASATVNGYGTVTAEFSNVNTNAYLHTGPYIYVGLKHASAYMVVDAVVFTIDEALPPNWPRGSGASAAWVAGNAWLTDHATPPPRYTTTFADLHAYDPVAWPYDIVTLGATGNVRDTDLDITTAQRIVELTRDHKSPRNTQVQLTRRPPSYLRTITET